ARIAAVAARTRCFNIEELPQNQSIKLQYFNVEPRGTTFTRLLNLFEVSPGERVRRKGVRVAHRRVTHLPNASLTASPRPADQTSCLRRFRAYSRGVDFRTRR